MTTNEALPTLEQVRDEMRCFYGSSIRPAWPSLEAWADAIDAHLKAQVPEGWVLVPVEPTEEMLEQACTHDTTPRNAKTDQWNRDTWSFMLNAAPTICAKE